MGGKQNRTKNNTRPSNSGRSAAMLNSASLPQFAGFSGGNKSSGLSLFSFNSTDEFDASIDGNFQLILRKVSKKDCTTKMKGLQEFADLLQKTEVPIVKTLLPIWPRIYSLLVIHPDNRIREATQNVHHIIVLKVKRDIAPYLKQLMAPWYTSQYDNYPPAAAAAIQAFKDTFSAVKFKEAVIFCHVEILNYIHDNLLIQTAETLSSYQFSPQEADARYERVVISCLQGYSMYLKEVPEEKITESLSLNTQILSNKKFWKLATSKVLLVRSSWFQVISVILQKSVYLLKNKEAQTLLTILNNLGDNEPTVLTHIWECLLLVTSIPEWWKGVNIDQHFIPKIFNILKQAGHGNAFIIYPNFLPLLSNVPLLEDNKKKQFYINFFEHMSSGLKLKPVASSSQESKAISAAYHECLQYLITKNVPNVALCKSLIKQYFNLLEWCLTKEAVSYKSIFSQAPNFILFLERNNHLEGIQTFIEYFFDSLYDIFYRSLNHSSNNMPNISLVAEKQVELLMSLKKIDLVDKQPVLLNNEYYLNMVKVFEVKIFKMFLTYTEQGSSNELIEQMYILINGFGKDMIFENVLEQMKEENEKPQLIDIYRKWFKTWLLSDKMYCKSVLDLIFVLLADLGDNDKETVLNDLLQINQPDCLTWSLSRALLLPHVKDHVVQNWLKGNPIGDLFVSIADKCMANECSPDLAGIFNLALTENSNGEVRIGKEVLARIIENVSTNISNDFKENKSLDSTCNLAIHICEVIYTKTHLLTYQDQLLLALFNLSCKFEGDNNSISANTSLEVNSVCKNSLIILLQNLKDSDSETLIEKLFNLIEDNFKLILINRHRGHIDHLSIVVMEMVDTIYKSCPCLLKWLVRFLFRKSWIIGANIGGLCKVAEYVKGTLDSPYDEIPVQKSPNEEEMLSYFVYNFLKIQVLSTSLISNEQIETEESLDKDTNQIDTANIRLFNLHIKPEDNLLEVLYSYTITDTFLMHFNNVKYYNEIIYYHRLFEQRIYDMFEYINQDTLAELKRLLKDNCLNHGWFWCRATHILHTKILKSENIFRVYDELEQDIGKTKFSLGTLHLEQTFKVAILKSSSTISTENVDEVMTSLFAQIDNLRNENLQLFLFEHSDMSWQDAYRVIRAVKRCTVIMKNFTLTPRYWDLIVLSMVSWVSNCLKAKHLVKQYQYQSMLVAVTELYITICKKVEKIKQEQTDSNYVSEWEEVLFEGIHADVAQIWIFLADHFSKCTEDSLVNLPFLQCFGKVADFFKSDLIFQGHDNLPKMNKFLKISSGTLLTNSQAIMQLWGYKMLLILVPGLVKIDENAVNTTTPHRNGLIFEQFKDKLIEVQDIVNSVLIDFRIGENSCKVEPSYDSFTYTFAYLLLWDVLLCLCDKASTELRYQYSDWLKHGSLLHEFLTNLFKLMPTEVLQHDEGNFKFYTDDESNDLANSTCYFNYYGSATIEKLARNLYKSSLEQIPALVRQWWTVLDIKTSQVVEKVTVLYASPHICNSELSNVVQHQNTFKNLKVKVMPSVREIQAVYTVDETQMELTITLPSNYPLGSPNIICNRQISGTSQKQWLLQFKKCVLHQNGKIWDGLSLWNSNLDRKFDGVEECYICYAVLHSGTYQLPRLCCRTCKKKFHSACLYKWFSTSNKSSCPICRNLF